MASNAYGEFNYSDPRCACSLYHLTNKKISPYLLVYTQRLRRPSETQKKQGFPEFIFKFTKKDDNSLLSSTHLPLCTTA